MHDIPSLPLAHGEASLLLALFEQAEDGLLLLLPDGAIERANERASTLFNRQPTQLSRCTLPQLLPNLAWSTLTARLPQRVGAALEQELWLPREQESATPLMLRLVRLTGGRLLAILRDNAVHEVLYEELQQLHELLDTATDLFAALAPDLQISWLNQTGYWLLGLDPQQPLPCFDTFCTLAEAQRLHQELLPAARDSGSWRGQIEISLRDGHTLTVDLQLLVHLDRQQQLKGWSLLLHDRGLIDRLSSDLQRLRSRLADVQAIASVGNWEWEIASGALWWSDEIYHIFGQQRARYAPSYDNFMATLHPDDREWVTMAVQDALDGSPYTVEHRIIRPDGSERVVHEQGRVDYEQGTPVRMVGTVQDITEHAFARQALRREHQLVDTINRLQTLVISDADSTVVFDRLLIQILELSGSVYGFIGELEQDSAGVDCIRMLAISNLAWDDETRHFYDQHIPVGMRFYGLDRIYALAAVNAEPVICNDLPNHPASRGTPHGHPPINTFLGLPLKIGERVVGAIGLANREGGYDSELAAYMMPVAAASAHIIENYQVRRARDVAEQALRASELRLRNLTQSAADAIISIDDAWQVVSWNSGATQMFGYSESEILGQPIQQLLSPRSAENQLQQISDWLAQGGGVSVASRHNDYCAQHRDGDAFPIEMSLSSWQQEGRQFVTLIARDVTERRRAEEHWRLAAAVINASADAIMVSDHNNRIELINDAFTTITGYHFDEVRGRDPSLLASGRTASALYRQMWQSLHEQGLWRGEIWNRRRNGEIYPEWLSITVLTDERGQPSRYVAIFSDITERKQAEELIRRQANYDALTHLPNRTLFGERLANALDLAAQHQSEVALLFLDLDRFKAVNDNLGHAAGDELLIETARRLRSCVREGDTVARLGGDEFVIVMPELSDHLPAEQVAEQVISELQRPFAIANTEAFVSTSIGIAFYPADGDNGETLQRKADMAMYRAKSEGRATYRFFTERMDQEARDHSSLQWQLRRALRDGQLRVVYQPIIDLSHGGVSGCEALLRWDHPERGEIPPDQFIPLAEEDGMINELGEWVLRCSCEQLRLWHEQQLPLLPISINLSPKQCLDMNSTAALRDILADSGIDGSHIIFELTEGVVMSSGVAMQERLTLLRETGARIALDDFGTGFSSLSYLSRLPIDRLKVARAFVQNLPNNHRDAALVDAIVGIGHALGIEVVGEGVEHAEQLEYLQRVGCDSAQGFLIAPPLSPEQLQQQLPQLMKMF